jgi:hypothetical protein
MLASVKCEYIVALPRFLQIAHVIEQCNSRTARRETEVYRNGEENARASQTLE